MLSMQDKFKSEPKEGIGLKCSIECATDNLSWKQNRIPNRVLHIVHGKELKLQAGNRPSVAGAVLQTPLRLIN